MSRNGPRPPVKQVPNEAEEPVALDDLSDALNDGPDVDRSTPFPDLEAALGLGDEDFSVAEVLTTIECRKPKPTEFFMVHPDPKMAREAWVFIDKEEIGSPVYLIQPKARRSIADHLRPVLLVVCTNRQSTPFLWAIKLPDHNSNSGRHNEWGKSALRAMEIGKKQWTQLKAGDGKYSVFIAESKQLPEPVWLDKSFAEIINLAFRENVIDSPTHPIVQRLRGLR